MIFFCKLDFTNNLNYIDLQLQKIALQLRIIEDKEG